MPLGQPMLKGATRDFTPQDLRWIAEQFDLQDIRRVSPFKERGNINQHTYEVEAGGQHYLMQRLNTDIFRTPDRVMSAMKQWIGAQVNALEANPLPYEPITLVPTKSGRTHLDLSDETGMSVWRTMVKIKDAVTFKSLSSVPTRKAQLEYAEETGKGLALSADLTSKLSTDYLISSLPGYRDTKGYYAQFHSVLAGNRHASDALSLLPEDEEIRGATLDCYVVHQSDESYYERMHDPEVAAAVAQMLELEPAALRLVSAMDSGEIRNTAIHGDTKIDNFLFCKYTGKVRSLIDLDTIMPFTWLADWGDMMRSMCNVAGEKEADLDKIQVDREVYSAVTQGFMKVAKAPTSQEVHLMAEAVEVIALELSVRFMTDYLRGDNYFCVDHAGGDPADINKIRALGQLTLYSRLREARPWAQELIEGMA